ncbi:MAG TPA: LuxR C-terminal-related transcriptional regulator, partial [Acidimicrobiales bacterium]|nr:LuxR C-terminal-related transcriptional regulator [Acidimicrobiales bacterium]
TLGSDLDPSPELFTAAGQVAVGLADFRLAERLARGAVAAGAGFDARLLLACALAWLGRGEQVEAELAALAAQAGSEIQQVSVAVPRAGNLFCVLGRPADAEGVLDAASATVTIPEGRGVLQAVRCVFDAWLGRAEQAVGSARDLLAPDEVLDPVAVFARWGLTAGLAVLGCAGRAGQAAVEGYEVASRMPDGPMLRLGIADHHVQALRLAGRVAEAGVVARERHAESAGDLGPAQAMGVALLGQASLAAGRLTSAIRQLREARAGLLAGDVGWDVRCLIGLTQALAQSGDPTGARDALGQLEARHHPGYALFDPEVLLAGAWVAAGEGALTEAVERAQRAAELARGRGHAAYEVLALHAAVRLGDPSGHGRLAELALRVEGTRAPAAAAQARALVAGDGDGLLAVSRQLEEHGDVLAAADAAAQAAAAFSGQGRQGRRQVASAEAHRLAEACEGARTPAVAATARPLPLTNREWEIVSLAAQGLSNREIADRLVVAVRTVEGHLYRVGSKLGIKDRRDFAKLVGSHAREPRAKPVRRGPAARSA